MKYVILYVIFAAVATGFNIAGQEISIRIITPDMFIGAVGFSIMVGTGVGLVIKYILDKKYIFHYTPQTKTQDGKTFILYTIMGLATTVIFWGTEYAFHLIYETKEMRYVGAIIGLGIGYVTKYWLDKKYVFK